MYEKAKEDDLDIVISNIILDFKDNQYKNYKIKDLDISETKIINGKEYIEPFFLNNFYGFTWNKLIRKKLYVENNLLYNEDIFCFEDVEMIIRLAYFAKKKYKLEKTYYNYLQGDDKRSRKLTLKNLEDKKTCFDKLLEYYNKKMKL